MLAQSRLQSDFGELTDKQLRVLQLVSQNMTGKEMARELGVSPSSIEQRLRSIRNRFGPLSRHELAQLYAKMNAVAHSPQDCEPACGPLALASIGKDAATLQPGAAGRKSRLSGLDELIGFTRSVRFIAGLILGFVLGGFVTGLVSFTVALTVKTFV